MAQGGRRREERRSKGIEERKRLAGMTGIVKKGKSPREKENGDFPNQETGETSIKMLEKKSKETTKHLRGKFSQCTSLRRRNRRSPEKKSENTVQGGLAATVK